ncbi:MAG: hypothetical protein HQM13_03815 [SAR324 cluster bacterium]|nr:hypothetical protein [SAR324 cluster bacterium]
MRFNEIFLGKRLYWMIWIILIIALYILGAMKLHVRSFIPFILILLGLSAVSVLTIMATYRKGERITREPFDDP